MRNIKITEVHPQLVIGMKRIGACNIIPETLMEVHEYALNMGARIIGLPSFLCRMKTEDDFKESLLLREKELEVVWPIESIIRETHSIKCYELPGGTIAEFTHIGPYDSCEETYAEIFSWINESNKKIMGPIRHIYLDSPDRIDRINTLTVICVPIE